MIFSENRCPPFRIMLYRGHFRLTHLFETRIQGVDGRNSPAMAQEEADHD